MALGGLGGGLRIHPRVFTFSSLEWKAYKGVFIQNVFQKRQDPSTMISHIKNISVGLWLHKRDAHTISKYIQVVCELELYTQGLLVVPATQGCAVGAEYVQSPQKNHRIKKKKIISAFYVGASAPSWGVFMQWCTVKNKQRHLRWAVYTSARAPARTRKTHVKIKTKKNRKA